MIPWNCRDVVGPQQPMPSSTTIQSMVLQAANQATLTAQANLGVAMSASALAQDPAHQQVQENVHLDRFGRVFHVPPIRIVSYHCIQLV